MKNIYLILFATLFCALYSCKQTDITESDGLNLDGYKFASPSESGALAVKDDQFFKKGDVVCLILTNVGKFKKGEDGLHKFEMSVEVTDSDGKVIYSQSDMLGENGHVLLPNNVAVSPYGVFNSSTDMVSGRYLFKLTIIDKIGTGKVSKTVTFNLN